jgi:hypothetical protein
LALRSRPSPALLWLCKIDADTLTSLPSMQAPPFGLIGKI